MEKKPSEGEDTEEETSHSQADLCKEEEKLKHEGRQQFYREHDPRNEKGTEKVEAAMKMHGDIIEDFGRSALQQEKGEGDKEKAIQTSETRLPQFALLLDLKKARKAQLRQAAKKNKAAKERNTPPNGVEPQGSSGGGR